MLVKGGRSTMKKVFSKELIVLWFPWLPWFAQLSA